MAEGIDPLNRFVTEKTFDWSRTFNREDRLGIRRQGMSCLQEKLAILVRFQMLLLAIGANWALILDFMVPEVGIEALFNRFFNVLDDICRKNNTA